MQIGGAFECDDYSKRCPFLLAVMRRACALADPHDFDKKFLA